MNRRLVKYLYLPYGTGRLCKKKQDRQRQLFSESEFDFVYSTILLIQNKDPDQYMNFFVTNL